MRIGSIRTKLLLLVIGTTLTMLALSGTGYYLFERGRSNEEALAATSTLAAAIAHTLGAAVIFRDLGATEQILGSFAAEADIQRATVYDDQGVELATYVRKDATPILLPLPILPASSHRFEGGALYLSVPIRVNSESVGALVLEHSLSRAGLAMERFLNFGLWVVALGTAIGGTAAVLLSRLLTRRLRALGSAMDRVSGHRDFTVRAPLQHDVELEQLCNGFNAMLDELGKQDAAIKLQHETLELRVAERTEKLRSEIAERERMEHALRREKEVLRSVVRSAPVAMAMFDLNMCYVTYSQKWVRDYSIESADLQGVSYYETIPEAPDRWRAVHQNALRGQHEECAEDSIVLPSGLTIYLRWAVHPWYEPDGERGGIIIATERIDDLVRAKHQAIQNAELKSQFLTNVSHELRTPLNGILGLAELLLDENMFGTEQRHALETIQSSGKTLLVLINDLLDLSRLEHGKVEIQHEPFEVRRVLDESVAIVEPDAQRKGLGIYINVLDSVPKIALGDAFRIQQVVLNLLGNAVKFTDYGRVDVTVSANEVPTGWEMTWRVRDTGIGIPSSKFQHIFQPFAQADGSITRQFGGTGLGLAISDQLARLMGGALSVESTPDQGSIFTFTALLGATDRHVPAGNATTGCDDFDRCFYPRPLRVLVAEDNSVNQQVIRSLLVREGHDVTLVTNGEEACEAVNTNDFDVILMDLQMPVLGGVEATSRIRQLPDSTKRNLPIIALTAHAFRNQREEALARGMNAYLTKPISRSELRSTLTQFVSPPTDATESA